MTLSRIELDSSLSSYFHPDEFEVILSEIFYLPFFLRKGDISTVSDITKYGLKESSQILTRIRKIHQIKPVFEESSGESMTINLNALIADKGNLAGRLFELKASQQRYRLNGQTRKIAFSAAMYLIEEGVKVTSYAVTDN